MDYTKRRNLNRGFMKLDAWQRGMDLFAMAVRLCAGVSDFKLKSQFSVENKLLKLIESLEAKRGTDEWSDTLPTHQSIHPRIQQSTTPL